MVGKMFWPWRGTRGRCKDDFRERAGRLGKRGRPWRFSLLARIVDALVGSTHAYLSGFFVGDVNETEASL